MIDPHALAVLSRQLVRRDFELEQIEESDLRSIVLEKLAAQLEVWLQRDLERLFQSLYRLDVSEAKVRAILDGQVEGQPAQLLAELILAREEQRAKTRLEYS